jgi:hypothetical protein
MAQRRELVPLSIYLPPEVKAEADRRADEKLIATGTLLRLILLGKEPPLAVPAVRPPK